MDFEKKYLKYKTKYINIKKQQKILGGSYTISSVGTIQQKQVIIYPEVSIIINKSLGSGGSGSVDLGIIVDCARNNNLLGKKVAIKSFFADSFSSEAKKNYEKSKMISFHLDEDNQIIENPNIASLYFDITNGPLKDCLVYEYGGDILSNYITNPNYNLENNKRIIYQLFTILYQLSEKDNMHNDIKCENIVYTVDSSSNVNIKLIDFGSSMSILSLNNGTENFGRRTNMNTPETIHNHLINNKSGLMSLNPKLNNFNKWYYYPFISIVCFLFTGIEYSTGNSYLNTIIEQQPSRNHWKLAAYNILINNDNVKQFLRTNVKPDFISKLSQIELLIDSLCKVNPSEREEYSNILVRIIDL